jgi:hypothetical protein
MNKSTGYLIKNNIRYIYSTHNLELIGKVRKISNYEWYIEGNNQKFKTLGAAISALERNAGIK